MNGAGETATDDCRDQNNPFCSMQRQFYFCVIDADDDDYSRFVRTDTAISQSLRRPATRSCLHPANERLGDGRKML